jgi:hypothetical protein
MPAGTSEVRPRQSEFSERAIKPAEMPESDNPESVLLEFAAVPPQSF